MFIQARLKKDWLDLGSGMHSISTNLTKVIYDLRSISSTAFESKTKVFAYFCYRVFYWLQVTIKVDIMGFNKALYTHVLVCQDTPHVPAGINLKPAFPHKSTGIHIHTHTYPATPLNPQHSHTPHHRHHTHTVSHMEYRGWRWTGRGLCK